MISFPWDSKQVGFDDKTGFPLFDRTYKAQELRELWKTFFSNGVFGEQPDAFVVTPGEGMNLVVTSGRCFIEGDVGVELSTRQLALTAASSDDRIDTVVLRWDNNIDKRSLDLYIVSGVASATPVRPSLTRGETIYELGIADIYIPKNTTAVAQERITDTRLETARCGLVTPFATIDTTTFYNQIQAAVDKQIGELQYQTDIAINLARDILSEAVISNEKIDELWGSTPGESSGGGGSATPDGTLSNSAIDSLFE